MTLCIAAMCDDRQTLVLAADNLLSIEFVSAELPIQKAQQVHPNWWMMLAGDASNALDIIDWTKQKLGSNDAHTVEDVNQIVADNYHKKRMAMAESEILRVLGWTMDEFRTDGINGLGAATFARVQNQIATYDLGVQFLVAGFGSDGLGHISYVGNPGVIKRHDLAGFYAIGVGMFGALYFMFYRTLGTKMSVAECVYYVYEAHYFGYQSGGVGDETDILVLRHGESPLYLDDRSKTTLMSIWADVLPREPKRLYRIDRHLDRLKQKAEAEVSKQENKNTA